MSGNPSYRFLLFAAVALGFGYAAWAFYDGFALLKANPAEAEYRRAARDFKDEEYALALAAYERALSANPDFASARLGRAESLLMLGRLEESLADFNRAIQLNPESAVAFANRGNALDRMGRHEEALADYERALQMDSALADGPGWLTRFFRNQPDKPPTIADRARYLRAQLQLPADERILQKPEEDAKQRPYEY